MGDFVIVVNADKVKLTGNKMTGKVYYSHSGYMGGLKSTTPAKVLGVRTRNGSWNGRSAGCYRKRAWATGSSPKLKVYVGPEHPHKAQQPKVLAVNE